MREVTVKLFKFDELSDDAKETAREWMRRMNQSDTYSMDEITGSLFALFKAAGITLTDWSLGGQGSFVRFDLGDAEGLKGARAMAWLENNLFGKLRVTHAQFAAKRKEYMSYGQGYRPGQIELCPLTGMCYDEDFLDELRKDVKEGATLKEAFCWLADQCARMIEDDYIYRNEDEQIDEDIRVNEYEFTEDGERA